MAEGCFQAMDGVSVMVGQGAVDHSEGLQVGDACLDGAINGPVSAQPDQHHHHRDYKQAEKYWLRPSAKKGSKAEASEINRKGSYFVTANDLLIGLQ